MTAKRKIDPQSLKPYPEYPLTIHPVGQWCKKIKGKRYYFGPINDPDKALKEYVKHRDNLQAGLGRVPNEGDTVVLTVVDLCNKYLDAQDLKVQNGELSPVTFSDCYRIANNAAEIIGKTKPVTSLTPEDFNNLRSKLAETRNLTTLKTELQKIKSIFNFAYAQELIDKPIRLKVLLKTPARKAIRAERNNRESQMIEPADLRKILTADSITTQMRAMVLLGLNCAFGASDLSSLPESAVDLTAGWIDYPRPKTGIPRRCPLWPETIDAIRAALARRPVVKDEAATGCVFVTRYGSTYVGLSPQGKYIIRTALHDGYSVRGSKG